MAGERHSLGAIELHRIADGLRLGCASHGLGRLVSIDLSKVLACRLSVASLLRGANGPHDTSIVVFGGVDSDGNLALGGRLGQREAICRRHVDLFSGLRCRLLRGLLLEGLLGLASDLRIELG